ncbi:hypothetical protein D3C76_1421820 [compost metagenome]
MFRKAIEPLAQSFLAVQRSGSVKMPGKRNAKAVLFQEACVLADAGMVPWISSFPWESVRFQNLFDGPG